MSASDAASGHAGFRQLHLSPLGDEQVDDAVALWEEAGLTRPWNDPHADCRRAMAGPASDVLAAYDDEALIGTVMVGHEGHRGWMYYLAVAAPWRGDGVGALLVAAAEQWQRDRGIPKVMLMVREDNDGVVDFYDRLGYQRQNVVTLGRFL